MSPPTSVFARACCRADLAGGTLDIWPVGLLYPGAATVNVAVDVAVTVRLSRREAGYRVRQGERRVEAASAEELATHEEGALVGVVAQALSLPPVEVELSSASPRGGGLGASSAMAVALIAAAEELAGERTTPAARVALARDLEARLMRLPTGIQDHYPPLLGGALVIEHRPAGEQVRRLTVDLPALGERLRLYFTGIGHFSAGSNWQILHRFFSGEPEVRELFAGIARAACEMVPALERGEWPEVGRLVGEEWSHRRRLAPGITTPLIDRALEAAAGEGAWGGKACGAGGGGCLLLMAPHERWRAIETRLVELGLEPVPAAPSAEPLAVSTSTS